MRKQMLYRLGGSFQIGDNMFELKTIDQDVEGELEKHLADGWHETPNDALNNTLEPADVDAEAEYYREGLEARAKELGIGFNVRTTNETLSQRIAEALEE